MPKDVFCLETFQNLCQSPSCLDDAWWLQMAFSTKLARRCAASSFLFSSFEEEEPEKNPFGETIKPWNSSCPSWMPGGRFFSKHGFCKKLKPLKHKWFPPQNAEVRPPYSSPAPAPGRRGPPVDEREQHETHPPRGQPRPATDWEATAQEQRQEQQAAQAEPPVPFTAPPPAPKKHHKHHMLPPPVPLGEVEGDSLAPAPVSGASGSGPSGSRGSRGSRSRGARAEEEPFEPRLPLIVEQPHPKPPPKKSSVGTFEMEDSPESKMLPPNAGKLLKELSKESIDANERELDQKMMTGGRKQKPAGRHWPPPQSAPPVQPIPPRCPTRPPGRAVGRSPPWTARRLWRKSCRARPTRWCSPQRMLCSTPRCSVDCHEPLHQSTWTWHTR
ncbi:unnamed protein product [Effrenium voratum]|uniref:Uncharacterized protein n=1 Tax=Effrenium voratum TaxID=2562239 RepID=A0AA36MMW2_9DINO|nr:unnamed protein product [Effrenium voratum]CAJ1451031.1 unnamed protein product [Effrenium voratum]